MTAASRFVARSQRTRDRGAQFLFVVVVGLIAAASIALIAGARRSSSVIDRFFAVVPAYDAQIYSENSTIGLAELQALPEVVGAQPTPYMSFNLSGPGIEPENAGINSTTGDFSQRDPTARVLRGRIPSGDLREVVVNEAFVAQFGLDVGDSVPVIAFANTAEQYEEISRGVYNPTGPSYQFTIAAVVRFAQELATNETRTVPGDVRGSSESQNLMVVANEFWYAHHSEFIDFGSAFSVHLTDHEASYQQFQSDVLELDPAVLIRPWAPDVAPAVFQSSVALESGVLLGVGIGAAFAGLALILVLVRVQQRRFEDDRAAEIALGFTRAEQVSTALWRTLPVAGTTAIVAAIVAITASGLFPVGLGKQLELEPGIETNIAVVVAGGILTLLVPLLAAAVMTLVRGDGEASKLYPTQPTSWTRRLPIEPSFGVRFAFGDPARGGRRASLLGLGVGVLAATAALTVTLWVHAADHVYATPAARGWMWDVAIGNTNFPIDPAAKQIVSASPEVAALTSATFGSANLNGDDIFLMGIDPGGAAPPSVIAGWLPSDDHELAMSATLMQRFHVGLGDKVTLRLEGWEFREEVQYAQPTEFTVVGQSVAPELDGDFVNVAIITFDGFNRAGVTAATRVLLVDVNGSNQRHAIVSLIEPLTQDAMADRIPTRVVSLHRVRALPLVGAALALLVVLATLVASAIAASQRHRYALGVLSALGLHRRGLRRVVAWQGLASGVVIVLVACPLALIVANAWWGRVAAGLGIRSDLAPPIRFLLVTISAIVSAATITALTTLAGRGRRLRLALQENGKGARVG